MWKQQVLEVDLGSRKLVRRTDVVDSLHNLGLQVGRQRRVVGGAKVADVPTM